MKTASIVINNYNYGRFLGHCIDSALAQTYPQTEVVVVDDGSTDHSQDVIRGYGDRITAIFQPNGGQASAINTGFAASSGDVVLFLDADDAVYPQAIERAIDAFADSAVVKVHWPLKVLNDNGRPSTVVRPFGKPARGDLRPLLAGPKGVDHLTPPQSGNMWTRAFLKEMLPVDEAVYRTGGADSYLSMLSMAAGRLAAIDEPMGIYRVHNSSHWNSLDLAPRIQMGWDRWRHTLDALEQLCRKLDLPSNPPAWERHSYFYNLKLIVEEIVTLVPEGESYVLADEDTLAVGEQLRGRRRLIFHQRDGEFAGAPADSDAAIDACETARVAGAHSFILAWPAFWYLDYYKQFAAYLNDHWTRQAQTDRLIAFRPRATSSAFGI